MIYSLNSLYSIYSQFSGSNLPANLESHHAAALSHLNNDQVIPNARKLMSITKTYRFNSLSEVGFVRMEVLHKPQKEAVGLFCSLIESPNLSEVQKALKRDSRFKAFAVEFIQDIVKDEMSAIVSNPKLSICKQHLKRVTRMITIKDALDLAKHAINYIVIAITNYYHTAVGKVSYLIITGTEISSQSAGAWQTG